MVRLLNRNLINKEDFMSSSKGCELHLIAFEISVIELIRLRVIMLQGFFLEKISTKIFLFSLKKFLRYKTIPQGYASGMNEPRRYPVNKIICT